MGLLHDVQRVKRVARRPGEKELTNTAEHIFEVAMLSWYVAATEKLNLDFDLIIKYALVHDIVEAYAGDTFIGDSVAQVTKQERERKALQRIEKEFSEFEEMLKMMHEYEDRATPEAQFVYAIDKLVDPLNLSMEPKDSMWKEYNMSLDTVRAYKDEKIQQSEYVVPYWEALIKKLSDRKPFFFHS